MKFVSFTALGATLAGAVPAAKSVNSLLKLTTEQVNNFEVNTLGGTTMRVPQVLNDGFMTPGRGQRAYLRTLQKYNQFGATIDPNLLCAVDAILSSLGLQGAAGGASASGNCPSAVGGTGQSGNTAGAQSGTGTGKGTGTGTGTGKGTGAGTGAGGNSTRPSSGSGTGKGGGTGTGTGSSGGNGTRPSPPGTGTGTSGGTAGVNGTRPAAGNSTANQGSAAAIPQDDVEYLTPVQIGTPPQTVMLDFDTGSSDLWVFTTQTPAAQSKGHQLYNPGTSSTASSMTGAQFKITYGDGSGAQGNVFTDVVSVGGVSVRAQAVEAATQVSGSFTEDTANSGLLGLAFDTKNQVTTGGKATPQKTFFSNAMKELASPLFTANLKVNQTGNYNFGFVDTSEFTGSVNFVPVNATLGFWQFAVSGVTVGQGQPQALAHQAIADTGTTLMLMPDAVVNAYYSQIPSAAVDTQAGGVVFNCNDTIPDLTAIINGYQAVIPGNIIKFAQVSANSPQCFGGIQSGQGLPFAIYGDIFLKAQFTVFDGGNMRIGFAPKSAGN